MTGPHPSAHIVTRGFAADRREEVAALFWQAFSGKLAPLMRPEARALAFIAQSLQPDHALCVTGDGGQILGVAGLKTLRGGLLAAGFPDIVAVYGWVGATWRAPILDLTERAIGRHELLLDGLFVRADRRGQGIGTALIRAAKAETSRQGKVCLRLDVVQSNTRARALYESLGFFAQPSRPPGLLRRALGFEPTTDLIWTAPPSAP